MENPKAIILAGQPGAGKGRLAEVAELELNQDVVKIDPDELRKFHPQVEALRNAHPYTWSGYTHPDASQWADELLQATIDGKKNLIFDTTLSNGEWSANLIKDLQARGYDVEVRAMAAHKLESELGVDNRFSRQLDEVGHGRYVPAGAREAIYTKLPISLDTVHAQTTAPIRIFDRSGVERYDSRTDPRPAGEVLQELRAARLQDPSVTRSLNARWQAQRRWHEALPYTLPHNQNLAPQVAGQLLHDRADLHVVEGAQDRIANIHTVDFNVRVKPVAIRGLGVAGAAATVYDVAATGHQVDQLRAQGNAVGAQAQLLQFGARNIGGWAGGVVGVQIGATAGVETGPGLVLTGLAGGALGAIAGSEAIQWLEQRKIYNQTDRSGVAWHLDPNAPDNGWTRQVVDAGGDHALSISHCETAPPQVADELTYKAASRAVQLRLATPDVPADPYRIPADASDTQSLRDSPWERNARSGQWQREVADGMLDHLMRTHTETATPQKKAELDDYAHSVMAYNAARSSAAIAAQYATVHAQAGWDRYGPMPEAINHARATPETLLGSDGDTYTRDAAGTWTHDGWLGKRQAEGNLRAELDQTYSQVQVLTSAHARAQQMHERQQMPMQDAPSPARMHEHTLRPGDRGTEVLALQASLIQLGINASVKTPVETTGIYDQPTERGVQAFQLLHGMHAVDGIADPGTRAAVQQQVETVIARRDIAQERDIAAAATAPAPAHSKDLPGLAAMHRAPPPAPAPSSPPVSAQSGQQQDMHAQALEQQRQWQLQQDQQLQLQQQQQQQQQQKQEQQREHERRAEDEKTRDAQRDKEQPATAAAAQGERTQPLPGLLPYSDPAHPRHALYADVQERMQAQGHRFSEERLTQITAALNESYFKPGWKGEFYVARNTVYASNNDHPLGCACVPMHAPAPSIQASMQVAQEGDLQHAQIAQRIAQDRLQSQSQPGMTL
ncbi:zeta toxin family protein [Xanthomonas fragariae]|uniref:zeta toxin family protein n=2 Tax=Xanthomonas fragariae TaxID=48664 RepID=UPI001ABED4E3|nr:zeta toxin family protein [Xanthomonas fragariae]